MDHYCIWKRMKSKNNISTQRMQTLETCAFGETALAFRKTGGKTNRPVQPQEEPCLRRALALPLFQIWHWSFDPGFPDAVCFFRSYQHPSCSLGNVLGGCDHEEVQAEHHGSSQVCTGNVSPGLFPVSFLLRHGMWECQRGRHHQVVQWVG